MATPIVPENTAAPTCTLMVSIKWPCNELTGGTRCNHYSNYAQVVQHTLPLISPRNIQRIVAFAINTKQIESFSDKCFFKE